MFGSISAIVFILRLTEISTVLLLDFIDIIVLKNLKIAAVVCVVLHKVNDLAKKNLIITL